MASPSAATPSLSSGAPYTVPPEPSRMPSVLLAVAMHAVLLGFLYVGVNWQNTEPVTVEAEVWDMRVQDAAPAPQAAPAPPPVPEPEPAPRPEPTPPPPPRAEPVKQAEPPPAKPDIALERKKQKELELKQQQEQEKKEKLREERLAEEKLKKEELKKEELKKKELAKVEQDKKLAEKKQQDKKEQDKKEQDKKLAEQKEKAEKQAADKLAKAKAAAEEKKLAAARAAEMARITGAAGSGTAAQSTAPKVDGGYRLAIINKVKNSTSYLGSTDVSGNPRVEYKVEQLPTGEILSARMTKSSGIPAFDEAVEKGIMKSSPLPKKKDGTVERTVTIGFSMKDLD